MPSVGMGDLEFFMMLPPNVTLHLNMIDLQLIVPPFRINHAVNVKRLIEKIILINLESIAFLLPFTLYVSGLPVTDCVLTNSSF